MRLKRLIYTVFFVVAMLCQAQIQDLIGINLDQKEVGTYKMILTK
jgi:hypothetical protein